MWEVPLVLGGHFLFPEPPPSSSSSFILVFPLFYPSVRGPHILTATQSRGASHGKNTGPLLTLKTTQQTSDTKLYSAFLRLPKTKYQSVRDNKDRIGFVMTY